MVGRGKGGGGGVRVLPEEMGVLNAVDEPSYPKKRWI